MQLESLLDCRSICDDLAKKYPELILSDADWKEIESMVEILRVPFQVTNLLEKVGFTMSDFYAAWLEMKFRLKSFSHKLAKCLVESMDSKKQEHLLQNPLMLCSVYLNPRLKADLIRDPQQCYVTKGYLAKLWERICEFSDQCKISEPEPPQVSTNKFDYSFLADYLSSLECETPAAVNGSNCKRIEFAKLLHAYEKMDSVDLSVSVLDFWEQNKTVFPELYKIANVAHAVPATQSSVERTFSSLTFVFNELRCNLSATLLEDVLLIKLNKELFNEIITELGQRS